MKRVQSACICQTLHFMLKDGVPSSYAVQLVQEEVQHYKHILDRNRTQYRILEETVQPDGSVILKIRKQYNQCSVGDYLDVTD